MLILLAACHLDPYRPDCLLDADGDGFGALGEEVLCGTDSAVEEGGDCDDADPSVSPEAPELCGDALDNDCDGVADGGGTPFDEVCNGLDDDCDGVVDRAVGLACAGAPDAVAEGTQDDTVGYSLAAGDVDGDGLGDVAIGARGADGVEINAGAATLHLSSAGSDLADPEVTLLALEEGEQGAANLAILPDGSIAMTALISGRGAEEAGAVYLFDPVTEGTVAGSEAGAILCGTVASQGFGNAVAGTEVEGERVVFVGAPATLTEQHTAAGVVYAFRGELAGEQFAAEPFAEGTDDEDYVGNDVEAGDLDGDGLAELVIAGYRSSSGAGEVWVLHGGTLSADVVDLAEEPSWRRDAEWDRFGESVAIVGDCDGDGTDDVAVSAILEGERAGWTFLLPDEPSANGTDPDATRWCARFDGEVAGDIAGRSVSGSGGGVLIGALYATDPVYGEYAGRAYWLPPVSDGGVHALSETAALGGVVIGPRTDYGYLGDRVVAVPDRTGDGTSEALVAATNDSAYGGNAGAAFLFFGESW